MATVLTYSIPSTTELARLLKNLDESALRIEANGEVYRVVKVNREHSKDTSFVYDPEAMREAILATAGSWHSVDPDIFLEDLYRAREEGSRDSIHFTDIDEQHEVSD